MNHYVTLEGHGGETYRQVQAYNFYVNSITPAEDNPGFYVLRNTLPLTSPLQVHISQIRSITPHV